MVEKAADTGRRWAGIQQHRSAAAWRTPVALVLVLELLLVSALSACGADDEADVRRASEISQYGITWKFDREYPVGQFVNGDWWVVGPVTVVSVTPGPSPAPPDEVTDLGVNGWGDTGLQDNKERRNGSMVVMEVGPAQGYDSRGITYDPNTSVTFPYTLDADRSLISSISEVTVPNPVMYADLMWDSEKTSSSVLKTAAVLTSLPQAPPDDAFRPTYVGANKKIFRASDLKWDLLQRLPMDAADSVPSFQEYERYLERPWLDHMNGSWEGQWLWPVENQPAYGREVARIVGTASLLLNTDASDDQKRRLLYELVQYGIDLRGTVELGAVYDEGGGHTSGRKWPILFAGLMLDDPSFIPQPRSTVFHEDAQTYYGQGWYGQKSLWQMVFHHGVRQPYQEKPPSAWDEWDRTSEEYRVCCTVRAWVGQGLAALLMGAKADWNHNAFFDTIEDWMRPTDLYAANREGLPRPPEETTSFDPFVDAFWARHHRDVPAQPDGTTDLKWDVNLRGDSADALSWVSNPKP
ncbi:hypothetical protein [Mycolicibacterium goodii]|uniref:Lipoprotein n=1 Tax=Mycolicibacterium goodii TaxID=134601 RepID=A0ABS6HPA3_MYCGD|nr:hypothetical protein [Mycolicibacterium goodii]MBU8823750.1 hypothetical protein [Mycolicibacterium goodii]MBU8833114.1 hypothetical protein [Mycolicibacterium goodii]MBU8835922.1 hypothetical protein [Mycolicibacterium goodii]